MARTLARCSPSAGATIAQRLRSTPSARTRAWTRDDAIRELLRGRLTILGPTTARSLAGSLSIDESDADAALLALESEGVVLRGHFEALTAENAEDAEEKIFSAPFAVSAANRGAAIQWCDRRLLPAFVSRNLRAWWSARRTSCGSCSRGGTWTRRMAERHRWLLGPRTVDGSSWRRTAGSAPFCPARRRMTSMIDTSAFQGSYGGAAACGRYAGPATPVALFLRALRTRQP